MANQHFLICVIAEKLDRLHSHIWKYMLQTKGMDVVICKDDMDYLNLMVTLNNICTSFSVKVMG